MAKSSIPLTHELLKQTLDYDPETGVFIWIAVRKGQSVGRIAGNIYPGQGYRKIYINNKNYFAHRLAWFYVHGEWPEIVDHINRDKSDNRIVNLRAATKSQNAMNARTWNSNTTGARGVSVDKNGRFHAYLRTGKDRINIGHFDTLAEAKAARKALALKIYGEFTNE